MTNSKIGKAIKERRTYLKLGQQELADLAEVGINTLVAIERVAKRVSEGGHNIPKDTIIRRYERGLKA